MTPETTQPNNLEPRSSLLRAPPGAARSQSPSTGRSHQVLCAIPAPTFASGSSAAGHPRQQFEPRLRNGRRAARSTEKQWHTQSRDLLGRLLDFDLLWISVPSLSIWAWGILLRAPSRLPSFVVPINGFLPIFSDFLPQSESFLDGFFLLKFHSLIRISFNSWAPYLEMFAVPNQLVITQEI
jgi:hypothetical protein